MKKILKVVLETLLALALLLPFCASSEASVSVSDDEHVYFGRYTHYKDTVPDDGRDPVSGDYDTAKPILWQKKDATTYLSVYLLDKGLWGTFDKTLNPQVWESGVVNTQESTLRPWLANTFIPAAFTAAEQNLLSTDIGAGANDPDTGAKVTIPSALSKDLGGNSYYGLATYRGKTAGAYYWTRSPDGFDSAWSVGSSGAEEYVGVDGDRLGVRPALNLESSLLIFKSASVFGTPVPAAGAAGNPYMLYLSTVVSKDRHPTATVNGNQLTLSFANPPVAEYPNVFHAYMDYTGAPVANNLATAFVLSDGKTVTGVSFNGPSIVLTLSGAYAYGATAPTIDYKGDAATDGIGFMDTGLVPTRLAQFAAVTATNVTPNPNPGPGPSPDPTPVTPPTPTEIATEFNNANPGRGVEVMFPTVTFTDPTGVATQLGGQPNILTPSGISGTTITPVQEDLPNFTGLGRGWGAKIDIQLKSSTATGQIDLLPVGLTFLLSSADLNAANWTDTDIVGNTAAFLAKAMFAKQQAEGANAGTLQDLTALLTDIVTITRDPSSPGGVRIDFPFLLANGEGAPKVITDNGKKYLVIFDGDRNGWLRDPVWLFRKAIVPTGIALTPTSLSLKKGESGNVTVVYTPTDATERDILWTGQGTDASVTVATVSKSSAADMWVVKGLTEGTVLLTATASADRAKKATLAVTVSPAASELIESVSVSPVPPYHVGTEVDVWVVLKRAPSSVTVSIKRPDGNTDTPTVTIDGTSAYATYTLPELGIYAVTVQATDATGTYTKAASLTVTEREVNGDSSSGGCNAGLVPQGLAPGSIMGLVVLAWGAGMCFCGRKAKRK